MAETRKHRVEVRDELDEALRAALAQPAPAPEAEAAAPETHHVTPFLSPDSAIAGFTFGAPSQRADS